MYSTLSVLFLLLVHKSNGQPLEDTKRAYDVKDFLQSPRVVGGEEAPPGSAKHMVALIWHLEGFTPSLLCGGSLVSHRHVLTAAHCFDTFLHGDKLSDLFKGVTGSDNWSSGENRIGFTSYKIHEDYDYWTLKNDIGLLISEDIKLDINTAIVPLNYKWLEGPAAGTLHGWGRTSTWGPIPYILNWINTTIITPNECQMRTEWANEILGRGPEFDPAVEICALTSYGIGACNGDSGSALLDKFGRQVGIVSWGRPCARGYPDMYVRVSGFKDFLTSQLN